MDFNKSSAPYLGMSEQKAMEVIADLMAKHDPTQRTSAREALSAIQEIQPVAMVEILKDLSRSIGATREEIHVKYHNEALDLARAEQSAKLHHKRMKDGSYIEGHHMETPKEAYDFAMEVACDSRAMMKEYYQMLMLIEDEAHDFECAVFALPEQYQEAGIAAYEYFITEYPCSPSHPDRSPSADIS